MRIATGKTVCIYYKFKSKYHFTKNKTMFYRALSSLELKLAVPNIGYKHTFLNIRLYKLIFPHNSNERLHVTHAHELWNCAEIFAEILLPKFFSNPLLLTN